MVWRQHLQRSVGVAGCPCLSPVHLQLPRLGPSLLPPALGATPALLSPVWITLSHTVPSPHTPWTLVRLNSDGWGLPSVPNDVQSDISLILKDDIPGQE